MSTTKKRQNRGNHGHWAEGDKPAMEKKGIPFDSELLHAAKDFCEDFELSSLAESVRALMRLGMESIGFPFQDMEPEITRKVHAKLAKLKAKDEQQTPDGDITLARSPVNVNASENASATVQIGKANRSVNVKKNHPEPVPASKRRK